MKVVIITPFFYYPVTGGMEVHVYNIASNLVKKGYEVEIFTSDITREGKYLVHEDSFENIKIKRFKTWFRIGDFGSFFPSVFKAIKNSDADLFHVHSFRHPHNLIPFFTKKPVILTSHWPNYPYGLRKSWIDFFINIFDFLFGKLLLNRFDKIIAVCKPEIDWLISKFNIKDENIILIPNGIPIDQLKRRDSSIFRKKNKISKDKLLVLALSRIHKSKGLDLVVQVSKFFHNVQFVIMGNGPELDNLKFLANDLKNIKFIYGNISDEYKLQAMSSADIFVSASHYEAFGITVLEAFSQGCAVLTSDSGGLPWVVGDCGLIFKDTNLTDFKNKLGLLVSNKDLRDKYQNKGLLRAKSFSWDNIVNDLIKIYKGVKK